MLDTRTASDTLVALIDQARRAGADAADAVYVGDRSTSVQVRLGALEDVSRSEGQEIGLRLFVGQQSAAVASSDLSRDSLNALVERAVAMAGALPQDQFAGLAPQEMLVSGPHADPRS
jgi:PmbA protein